MTTVPVPASGSYLPVPFGRDAADARAAVCSPAAHRAYRTQ